jgi:hypothetical protein
MDNGILRLCADAPEWHPRGMKLTATIVLSVQARTLADAGATLDEILQSAREHAGVDVQSMDLQTPPGAVPVTLPPTTAPPSPPRTVPHPHPLPNGRS